MAPQKVQESTEAVFVHRIVPPPPVTLLGFIGPDRGLTGGGGRLWKLKVLAQLPFRGKGIQHLNFNVQLGEGVKVFFEHFLGFKGFLNLTFLQPH